MSVYGLASAMIGPVDRAYVADIPSPGERILPGLPVHRILPRVRQRAAAWGTLFHLAGMAPVFLLMALMFLSRADVQTFFYLSRVPSGTL